MKYDSTRADLDFLNPNEMDPIEENEPTTLTECMQFAKDNDDFKPLESAIYTTEKNIAEAIEVLLFIRDTAQASGRSEFYIKQSNKALRILNRK
jgi:hypothetical protein